MSQITRCPSCATAFRVVADQLRISDGWVRCGHCKEIFDATAHMQEVPEQALLPDMPLDSLDAPAQPVAHPAEPAQVWGSARGTHGSEDADSFGQPPLADEPVPDVAPSSAPALLTLKVPEPGVPSFLVAQEASEEAEQNNAPPTQTAPFFSHSAADGAIEAPLPATADGAVVGKEGGTAAPGGSPADMPLAAMGYELPSVPLPEDDFEWLSEYAEPEPEPEPESEPAPEPAKVEAETKAEAAPPHVPETSWPPVSALDAGDGAEAPMVPGPRQDSSGSGGTADVQAAVAGLDFSAALEKKHTDSPSEQRVEKGVEEIAEEEASGAADEPTFVRTARRKAFWRQPGVRTALGLLSLLLVVVLLFQVVLSQRNYLAAAHPQWLPFLKNLCEPLQCKVVPYRQISSIVVDSSSFNKVRGDTYQFALALKNISDNVLEMPAIELTLTDTQDQPVLRRVLTRQDLLAPRTLAARGDWNTVLQIQLTVDGARIAGYRVLAFYP